MLNRWFVCLRKENVKGRIFCVYIVITYIKYFLFLLNRKYIGSLTEKIFLLGFRNIYFGKFGSKILGSLRTMREMLHIMFAKSKEDGIKPLIMFKMLGP